MKRYLLIMIAGFFLLAPLTSGAFSSEHPGCGGDCRDCHRLEKKDAEKILEKILPAGKLLDVKLSPVGGLWQLDVEAEGKRGSLYLDFSRKHLINGQIIPLEAVKVSFSKISLTEALVMGPKTATKKIVVFTDPDCPFCKKLHEEIKQVLAKRSDVAFYVIPYPLPMHKDAYKKVQSILCGKSLALLDDAFSGKALPEPVCPNEQVEKNIALAKELGFNGTPTLVRDDGTVLSGYRPAEQLSEWIDGK
ncbi:MAG TPA: DsbC family protein [Nitrospirota bacterium]|nr:DsbC family protein [Nitrospirota bacterium]